jgi:hypothetical protein
MSDLLSDRMDRVERALRGMTHANRQLTEMLLLALRTSQGGSDGSQAPAASEQASKRPQAAATAILGAVAASLRPRMPPPWSAAPEGIGGRMAAFLAERRERDAGYRSEGPGLRLRLNHDDQ